MVAHFSLMWLKCQILGVKRENARIQRENSLLPDNRKQVMQNVPKSQGNVRHIEDMMSY